MANLVDIIRYPVKGLGGEALTSVALETGQTLPLDRLWAVLHEGASVASDHSGWARCGNFARGAKAPKLMAVTVSVDRPRLTFQHPDVAPLTIDPADPGDQAQLVEWITAIYPSDRAAPVRVHASPDRGLTDNSEPTISIMSRATLRAMEQRAGRAFGQARFRGNLWIDEDVGPWEELEWVGKTLSIGTTKLDVIEPVERCRSTHVDTATGREDFPMLDHLEQTYGHRDFGVHAVVVTGGEISLGDRVRL